jgi:hypothetical protein
MLNEENDWVYLVIESQLGLTHPIHLHGHDFYLLDQQASATYTDASSLNLVNPPRRDVAMLPAGGYLVMGFMTDNPGVWLMHCHVSASHLWSYPPKRWLTTPTDWLAYFSGPCSSTGGAPIRDCQHRRSGRP